MTILYVMLNFYGFLFNTCAIHTQVNKQASVARILYAGFFGMQDFLEYYYAGFFGNTKLTASQLQNFHNNQPLSLIQRNYKNTAIAEHIFPSHSYPQSPVSHIVVHPPNIELTYEQIVEQPHTTNFRSQNNHLFSPR